MQGAERILAEKKLIEAATVSDIDALDLPEKDLAMLKFAKLLTESPHRNSPQQIEQLRKFGWTDAQIAESVLVIGMFAMFNRVADAFGLEDPEYFKKEQAGTAIVPATLSGQNESKP